MIVVIKDLYTLKSWEDQDTESLAFHLNNKKIWDNCRDGLPYPYTKGNARFFIKQAQEKTDISDFCITVGGEAIGNIGFVRGTDVERFNAEVGYWISEKYWNQGIVSDALTEAIQYYFAHTEVIRIFATVYEYNPASMRVLEKAGFRKTGIFRKACYKNGQFIDAHHFELVADKKLEENQKELEDMLKYDILEIYDFKGIDDTSYKVKIKNNSQKNLGNIILKVAEKNSDGEYISVSNISNNSTLKAKDFSALMLNSTDKENTLEIIGYTYDDIENKSNIDIDLKTNTASIVRN